MEPLVTHSSDGDSSVFPQLPRDTREDDRWLIARTNATLIGLLRHFSLKLYGKEDVCNIDTQDSNLGKSRLLEDELEDAGVLNRDDEISSDEEAWKTNTNSLGGWSNKSLYFVFIITILITWIPLFAWDLYWKFQTIPSITTQINDMTGLRIGDQAAPPGAQGPQHPQLPGAVDHPGHGHPPALAPPAGHTPAPPPAGGGMFSGLR